jgi:hypothetical protein
MNEFHDPLEAELAAFQPHEPSPALKRRIAEELNASSPPGKTLAPQPRARRQIVLQLSLITALIAACLLLAVWLPKAPGPIPFEPPHSASQSLVTIALDDSLPSVWTYHSALARRPETVDALLDQHTALTDEPKPQRAGVFVFTPSDPELDELLGEL